MFEKVLVALDFSPSSQKILGCIGEMTGVKEVVLLHVVDATHYSRRGWTHGPHIENSKIIMAEKKEFLENLGLKEHLSVDAEVKVIIQANVSHAILETAETKNVSLIIVGARGINPIHELLSGSVSSSVLRHAKTNVLVMHAGPEPAETNLSPGKSHRQLFSKVLVPTDFSRSAYDVSAVVKTIPGIKEIVLLHVVTKGETELEIQGHVRESKTRLEEMKRELVSTGINVTLRIRVGKPTEMILSVADEDEVSLIVMSAFGTDRFRELLLGSSIFTVVRMTKKPVLIIRTGNLKNQMNAGMQEIIS